MIHRLAKLIPFALFAACSSTTSSTGIEGTHSGAIELRLVDAPSDTVTEIVVTLTKIEAQVAGSGFVTLLDKVETVDLLKLSGGKYDVLGITKLPAGHVTQLRLYVSEDGPNYVTTPDGAHHPLKVPSGPESGIKLHGGFDVSPCATGSVTLDFDGKKSIFTHPVGDGAGDEWILRPVIRLKAIVLSGGCDDAGTPTPPPPEGGDAGTPTDVDGGAPPDPCAAVECPGDDVCVNGNCRTILY